MMEKLKIYLFLMALSIFNACQLPLESPTLLRGFKSPASSEEVTRFTNRAASRSNIMSAKIIGYSENNNSLVAVKIADPAQQTIPPLKVLIFAQQHGNEQSGKEAALLLISDFARNRHLQWLSNMEIWIVPQLNPDGSDVNERRNAGGIDLNRDHIVRIAPETRAIHTLFRSEMHHVTVDIHEYQPFRNSWEEFGGYKTFDVQVGVPTNLNIDQHIRSFALNRAMPAIETHLNQKGFSFHNYLVGPVPTEGRTRHSTVDLDDGRHSFAILNTLSFIYEGINGRDGFIENLERRTYGQYEALIALLNFLHLHAEEARSLVETSRENLIGSPSPKVAIRMEHFPGDSPLLLPLLSSKTGLDTLVVVENYHPVVKATLKVQRPMGYLIPAGDSLLVSFLNLHRIGHHPLKDDNNKTFKRIKIEKINTSADEELQNRFPVISFREEELKDLSNNYLMVPANQLHSNFLVTLFEPQSMLGLAQRPGFEYLMVEGEYFPILRVE